jgi:hypothetical protein
MNAISSEEVTNLRRVAETSSGDLQVVARAVLTIVDSIHSIGPGLVSMTREEAESTVRQMNAPNREAR